MSRIFKRQYLIASLLIMLSVRVLGQGDASASARLDVRQIVIGDQAELFLVVEHNPKTGRVEWPMIPDSLGGIEVVERGKIDTDIKGDVYTYRQRLLITGFDSGIFSIPSFKFTVIPNSGTPFIIPTDSFQLLVQTVPVDTTKDFKPIKNIVYVKGTWLDKWMPYMPYIGGGIVLLGLIIFVIIYFLRNKKIPILKPAGPAETLTEKTLRLLAELDAKQLWQKDQIKQYYIELTDIVRTYIEERFNTPAMELTTDEFLYKAKVHRDLIPYLDILSVILKTADLAKFAKALPMPQEHIDAMEHARKFVDSSRPVIIVEPQTDKTA